MRQQAYRGVAWTCQLQLSSKIQWVSAFRSWPLPPVHVSYPSPSLHSTPQTGIGSAGIHWLVYRSLRVSGCFSHRSRGLRSFLFPTATRAPQLPTHLTSHDAAVAPALRFATVPWQLQRPPQLTGLQHPSVELKTLVLQPCRMNRHHVCFCVST